MGGKAERVGKKETMLLLGAGASYGARAKGVGDASAPPIGDALAEYLLRWIDANRPAKREFSEWASSNTPNPIPAAERIWREHDRVDEAIKILESVGNTTSSSPHFELAMNCVVDAENVDLLITLHWLIAASMVSGKASVFDSRADVYDDLLDKLGDAVCSIMTLNYDILLEEALERLDRNYSYSGLEDPDEVVRIFKFHGSANWHQYPTAGVGSSLEIAQANSDIVSLALQEPLGSSIETGKGGFAIRGRRNIALHHHHQRLRPPLIAVYGAGKPATHGRAVLDAVREQTMNAIRQAERVVVIGIRPPSLEDDQPLFELIETATSVPQRLYVSPNDAELDEMEKRGFQRFRGTLEDYVATL